ncbi:ABC transporter ATP-binding protein [Candidatus Bathyarchaeota archaeon]|nr:ABC transporter ATP-binding protein [Candidatus Bathyarchaeota archaeon]
MLEINSLTVEVSGKRVLEDVDLQIAKGEVHVLFGPNGSGKSTLLMTILGFPTYRVVSGEIIFKGKDITNLPINERVNLGINVAFQNPPVIRGVKLGEIIEHWIPDQNEIDNLLEKVKFPSEFLKRDVNLGFSGGEIKKSEVLQMMAQGGDFLMLDEPDSGVDVENLQLVGRVIDEMLRDRSGLIITHQGYILRFVNADVAHVLIEGTIACSGKPTKILSQILREGYGWCLKCPRRKRISKELFNE